jgi:methionyl-tRNA formyltransferase
MENKDNMKKIKVLFMGTAEFAIPALSKLLKSEQFELAAVVTQPDKPQGRKRELTPMPVRQFLLDQNYQGKVYTPAKLKPESEAILNEIKPELIIVAAYGQIIPKNVIDYPKYNCLNIHGSILPKYRGAIPIEKALFNGDKTTGVSILKMTPSLDDGPVLVEEEIELKVEDDAATLRSELAEIGAEILMNVLPVWIEGEVNPIEQSILAEKREESYCYANEMSLEDAKIEAEDTVASAWGKIRGFAASRGAWLNSADDTILKIWKARPVKVEIQNTHKELMIIKHEKSLLLKLKDGYLELLELQLAGKKRDSFHNYLFLASQ